MRQLKISDFLGDRDDYVVLSLFSDTPLSVFKRLNSEFDIPYHISPITKYALKTIPVNLLRASINDLGSVPVGGTPHFQYLTGDREAYTEYYEKYFGVLLTADDSAENFDKMIANFHYGVHDGKRSLIVAEQEGRYYRILDGVHRAAILMHVGTKEALMMEVL